MKLKAGELGALHECLTWLRVPGNNPLNFYGEELDNFDRACKVLMDKIRGIIPEGSTRARIRCTNRTTRNPPGRLGDTLGDEARGMLVVDLEGSGGLSIEGHGCV